MLNALSPLHKLRGLSVPASTLVLANQTATFGTLTIAGAGAFKPVDAAGNTVALTSYNSLVSGSLGVYTPSILSGGLRFTGAAGAPNAAVLRCGYAGGTVDITISTVANTYSVKDNTERAAAETAITSAGGKTIRMRRGDFSPSGAYWSQFVDYTAQVIYEGEGAATSGKGTRAEQMYSKACSNILYRNIEFYTTTTASPAGQINATANMVYEDCYFHGIVHDPFANWTTGHQLSQAGLEYSAIAGFTVRRCLFEYLRNGITFNSKGACLIEDNEFRYQLEDCIQTSFDPIDKTSAKTFRRNVGYGTLLDDAAHSDFLQVGAGTALDTDEYANITIEQNVCFNSTLISAGVMQGFVSFLDSSAFGLRFLNPVVRGNIVQDLHLHSISFYNINGGTFTNNTICHMETVSQPSNVMQINLGLGHSAGTITVSNNVVEGLNLIGGATYVQSNNVILGAAGATISFSTAFDDPTPSAPKTGYTDMKAKRTAKVGGPAATALAGALGVGFGTYGTPRTPGEWSIP